MVDKRLESLKDYMELEANDLLAFWEKYAIHSGEDVFYGVVDADLMPHPDALKHVVLGARLVWTFSSAFRILRKQNYEKLAHRTYNFFVSHFIDREHGGAFWELNADGTPYDASKRTYGEAFAIYALSEYYRTFGDKKALDEAISIYSCLESHVYDKENKGYYEALSRDWKFEQERQVSNINPYESACKTMNTHLHLLEAYTSLYRVWKDESLKNKLKEHIVVMIENIVDHSTWHYMLFFDKTWKSLSPEISYGHDIEGSWLLWEAAEVLDDDSIKGYVKPVSIKMAEAVFNEGWHSEGGIIYESYPGGVKHDYRSWWVQSEAFVGFLNAWQLTGQDKYLDGALSVYEFIRRELIDHINGGWFSFGISDKKITNRVDGWTCPYHNARMCFETIERLQ